MSKFRNWYKLSVGICAVFTLGMTTVLTTLPAYAADITPSLTPSPASPPPIVPVAPIIDATGYVVMDANSGVVVADSNMNKRLAPASLTKLMTLYIIAGELESGRIKLTDQVRISENAWRTGGSRMFLKLGTQVSVQDLINGIIIASGNDACIAIAEYLAGTKETFADVMNQTAKRLGMTGSHFMDPTGLPNPDHYSTAYDLAILARAIINDYPKYYPWYKQKWIIWNGIKQPNRDRLLWRDSSVDGLKTGHTDEAGYCLVSSALRNGMRLVTVVMGAPSDKARSDETQALLNWGFRFFESYRLFSAGKVLATPKIWYSEKGQTPMGLARDLYVTIASGQIKKLKATLNLNPNLAAPIAKDQVCGTVEVRLDDKVVGSAPIVAMEENPKGGIISRLMDQIALFIRKWFAKV